MKLKMKLTLICRKELVIEGPLMHDEKLITEAWLKLKYHTGTTQRFICSGTVPCTLYGETFIDDRDTHNNNNISMGEGKK